MNAEKRNIDQWDRYWAYGNFHSFSQVSEGNYKGAIAEFWQTRFTNQSAGSHIVDIATGNGALALLALEESESGAKNFSVSATDLASIDPLNQLKDEPLLDKLKHIRFYPRTPAESLPFEDASVDMVCSQFGLEYSNVDVSVPEICRVLKSGGNLAFVAHHQESIHIQATHGELMQLEFILNTTQIFEKAQDVLKERLSIEQSEGHYDIVPTPTLLQKRELMKNAMDQIHNEIEVASNPAMLAGPIQYIREIFSNIGKVSAEELANHVIEARSRVMANLLRLQDMIAAAKSESDVASLQDLLQNNGLSNVSVSCVEESNGNILGWQVCACR